MRALDGAVFSRVVRAGALAVMRQQEALNHINVFPVRDADTGANLAATLKICCGPSGQRRGGRRGRGRARRRRRRARRRARQLRRHLRAVPARSGGRPATVEQEVDGAQFAEAATQGTDSAYSALQEPREGTILSVLGLVARAGAAAAHEEDFTEMMRRGLEAARAALADTPRQLEVLARSHVVDAGGQGFVFFLEGIVEALRGDHEVAWVPTAAPAHGPAAVLGGAHDVDDRFRYCTEALLTPRPGRRRSTATWSSAAVRGLGESLVVAGGATRVRVHLHTNEPQRFLAAVAVHGVDRAQQDRRHGAAAAGRPRGVARPGHRFHHRPAGGRRLSSRGRRGAAHAVAGRRRPTWTAWTSRWKGFLDRIALTTAVPRSSQPAVTDFVDTYRRLLEYREGIVSVHIAGALSGTVQAAATAAREVDPARIKIVDSCGVSVATGLVLEAVGEAIADGATPRRGRSRRRAREEATSCVLRHSRHARLRRARRTP